MSKKPPSPKSGPKPSQTGSGMSPKGAPGGLGRPVILLLTALGVLGVVHFGSAFSPALRSWGIDYWSEVGIGVRGVALVLLLVVLIPSVAGLLDRLIHPIVRSRIGAPLGLAILFVLFIVFRSHGHAYGDGYSFPGYFAGGGLPEFTDHHRTMALDLVSHWALYRFVLMPLGGTVELSYAVLGAAGGIASLMAVVRIARLCTRNGAVQWFLVAGAVTSGTAVLWFGYMESYALANAALLWVLAFAIEAQTNGRRIWTAWGLWVLSVAFHQLAMAALPAMIVAHVMSRRETGIRLTRPLTVGLWAAGFVGWALATFAYRQIGPPIFVPLLPTEDSAYGAFSIAHLVDAINLLVFVAPVGLAGLVSASIVRQEGVRNPGRVVLGVTAACLWYFAFWVDPLLGAFRDWDLLCAFGIPMTLWAGLVISDRVPKGQTPRWLWAPVAVFAIAHVGLYVGTLRSEMGAALRVDRLVREDVHYTGDFFDGSRLPPWAAIIGRILNRYDLAHEHLRRRVELDPSDALAWANLGAAYQKLGILDSSALAYVQALEREPDNLVYVNNLGVLYSMQNRVMEARDAFERVAAMSDTSYGSRAMLGLIYLQTGERSRAKSILAEAIALRPDLFSAYFHRGMYHESAHDTSSAIADYEAAVARGGGAPEVFHRLIQLYQWSGQVGAALNAAHRWIAAFPESPDPYFFAGTTFVIEQKYDSAALYLTASYNRDPQRAFTAYYLATALRETGQPAQAKDLATRATRLDTTLALPWLELVYLAADAGNRSEAVAATREYLRRSPRDSAMSYLQQFMER